MSDQALLWKFAFGALVLLFSMATYVGRKDVQPVAAASATEAVRPAPAPIRAPEPLPAAQTMQEPTPVDLPDAQETPVRIHISLAEPPSQEKKAAAPKAHRPPRHTTAPKLHLVHATRPPASHVRRASPYAIGRQHYPFDPRLRWRTREG